MMSSYPSELRDVWDEERRAKSNAAISDARETKRRYSGRCPRCGHETESARAGTVACKWGGCNGTLEAQPIERSSATRETKL